MRDSQSGVCESVSWLEIAGGDKEDGGMKKIVISGTACRDQASCVGGGWRGISGDARPMP